MLLYRIECDCGAKEFSWLTNGDGSVVEQCKACGALYAAGRWYQDRSLGVRVPALSIYSSLIS